jgi:GTP-binding protein HflX
VLVSDTVGFIQRLPHHLVASFHATLEEALAVDLLLHVVDASHPDAATQMASVETTLAGLTNRAPDVLVLNKIDRVADPIRLHLLHDGSVKELVHVSARSGEGLDRLAAVVARRLDLRSCTLRVAFDVGDGRTAAALRAAGVVLSEDVDEQNVLTMVVRLPDGALGNIQRALGHEVPAEILEPAAEPFLREELSA